ncbi:MAG: glycosyltransferase family 2 protein [Planctomycetota bacterium]|nr:glycosyltransferase family 2 protein [Planctomycetota bacterium]
MAPRLSACIITYNEERNIRACLESLRWADEIVVVDSGSEDRTREIAREWTDRVIENPWPGHIQQKNTAVDEARGDWILSLDADERCSTELAEGIRKVVGATDDGFAAYEVPRRLHYMGKWLRFGGWSPEYKVRLFKKGKARWGGVNPHDRVEAAGPVGRLEGSLLHYSYLDLADQLRQTLSFTGISATELYERGHRASLMDLSVRPFWAFVQRYLMRWGILDGVPGLMMAANHSFCVFLKYARLWEMERSGRRTSSGEDHSGDGGAR